MHRNQPKAWPSTFSAIAVLRVIFLTEPPSFWPYHAYDHQTLGSPYLAPKTNLRLHVTSSLYNSNVYGVGVRDRKDAGQDRHDELRLRGVRDGGRFRHEAGPVGGVFGVRGDGGVLRSNGQAHGALGRLVFSEVFWWLGVGAAWS